MMILPDYRVVFISTPKCATNSMYDILSRRYGGVRHGWMHERNVPAEYRDWLAFTIVRNPYARAVSIWYSTTVNPRNQRYAYEALGTTCFHTFLRFLLARPPVLAKRALCIPQTEWLAPLRISDVLRIESLEQDVLRLPFWSGNASLPKLNASDGCGDWRDHVDLEAAELIERWCPDDFPRFGYARLRSGQTRSRRMAAEPGA